MGTGHERHPRSSAAAELDRCDFQEYLVYCTHPDCVCEGSGTSSSEMVQGTPRSEIAKQFKADGWTWTKAHGWCCNETSWQGQSLQRELQRRTN